MIQKVYKSFEVYLLWPLARLRSSFIYQGISTRRQRSNLCDLHAKLPPVTTSLITQRLRQFR